MLRNLRERLSVGLKLIQFIYKASEKLLRNVQSSKRFQTLLKNLNLKLKIHTKKLPYSYIAKHKYNINKHLYGDCFCSQSLSYYLPSLNNRPFHLIRVWPYRPHSDRLGGKIVIKQSCYSYAPTFVRSYMTSRYWAVEQFWTFPRSGALTITDNSLQIVQLLQ